MHDSRRWSVVLAAVRRRIRLLTPVVLLAAMSVSIAPAAAVPVDSDGDGVADSIDIDDDNDGVIDAEEAPAATFAYATWDSVSGTTGTGTIGGTSFTYTSSVSIQTTTNLYAANLFPAQFDVPNVNPTIRNDFASTNTVTFSAPVLNPMVVFSSIGNPGTPVPVQFDRAVDVLWSQDVTVDSPTQITGREGYLVVRMVGELSSFSFDYLANEIYVNFAFGAEQGQAPWDTDADGIPDGLDLDSDGDGIPDTVEAQHGSFVRASGTDSDGNGLDDAFESSPGAGGGLTLHDSDNNGTPDLRQVDADGDGVNDATERGYDATAIDATLDADHDGIPDGMDVGSTGGTDADSNGIDDRFETADTDADGSPDYRDVDSDDDGNADGTDPHRIAVVAGPDSATTMVGVPVTVDVLANDDTPTGDGNTVTNLGPGSATGTVEIDESAGTITYTPAADERGEVTIRYQVCNPNVTPAVCATAILTVDVTAAPTAEDDTATTALGTQVAVDVLANDGFTVGPNLTLTNTGTGTAAGTAEFDAANGRLVYTPTADEHGVVTVVYRACDTSYDPDVCDTATVTVTITRAAVTGRVYRDLNRDGVIGEGESDISGVTVRLLLPGPDGTFGTSDDVVVATTVTASPFTFPDVAPGGYAVAVDASTLPRGMHETDDGDGGANQLMAVTVGSSSPAPLSFGQGYLRITGTFVDANGRPVGNAKVTVTDSAGNTFEVTTAADGSFVLEGSATAPLAKGVATVRGTAANGDNVSMQLDVASGRATNQAALTAPVPASFLPRTGGTLGPIVLLGLALLGIGGGVQVLRRRQLAEIGDG